MTKAEVLVISERLFAISSRQKDLLDQMWAMSNEAAELRAEVMKYLRTH